MILKGTICFSEAVEVVKADTKDVKSVSFKFCYTSIHINPAMTRYY